MSKKRLLLITNGFPFGDSERGFLYTEFQHLQGSFEVHVLARIDCPPQNQWRGIDSEHVSCIGDSKMRLVYALRQIRHRYVRKEIVQACKKCKYKLLIKRVSIVLRYSARAEMLQEAVERICTEKEVDLLYSFWCTQATLSAIRIKEKLPNLKVVVRFHGYDLYNERTKELWQPFRQYIASRCDKLVFVSEAGKRYFLSHWGKKFEGKTFVSYLGSRDMGVIECRERSILTVISCSNLIPLKRVEYIINAMKQLPEWLQVVWHHFGDGDERDCLIRQAREVLEGRQNILWKFWGKVPNDRLSGLYREVGADLFITTSSTEGGVPVSIQEAFSMGIPAVATAVGGIPEIVKDGRTGYLLPGNPEVEQVCEALLKFAKLRLEEKRKMAKNARSMWQEKCDANTNACRFVQMLKELLS